VTLPETILEVIDMRSFSNLWYWIGLAVVWSSASYFVLGVPNDMIVRARREGGQALEDVEVMLQINARRILGLARTSGLVVLGFVFFLLTSLVLMAFWYRVEFAQAVLFMGGPMVLVGALRLSLAAIVESQAPTGEELFRLVRRHRLIMQFIGLFAIFVTAMFGMYQNLLVPHGF